MDNQISNIIKRHGKGFIEVIAFDDKKKKKDIKNRFFDISKTEIKTILDEIEDFNFGDYGVFMNINPLDKDKRIKDNVREIQYCFIDLDNAEKTHNDLVKAFLDNNKIKYEYNAKSGNGYHFLIPVKLDKTEEGTIKYFLSYLKENICDKVDLATGDMTRLIRCPDSIHNKNKDSFYLETMYCSYINKEKDILNNNTQIQEHQLEPEPIICETYQNQLNLDDTFFNYILNSNNINYVELKKILDNAINRNDPFVKNLGFFVSSNPESEILANNLINSWEPARMGALKGWIKKGKYNNGKVNYRELLKWSNENKIELFSKKLREQLKTNFLDKIEFYFLEDEKPDYQYLIFYPEKNYFVQKNLAGLKDSLYFEAQELGIDLVKEFSLEKIEEWHKLNFMQKLAAVKNTVYTKLIKENRIRKVFNLNYKPTDEKFINIDEKIYFNMYKKTLLMDHYTQRELKEYYFPHIKELLMNLCGEDEKFYNYFNQWLAWIIQKPDDKLPTAIIFQGKQGSGKGLFKKCVLDNIFSHNCQEINQTHLEGAFNDYILGKQIIVANEVIHNENKKLLPNVLKNLVTEDKLTISRKFRASIVADNFSHWIFTTNEDNPLKIDEDDRRYSVAYSEKIRGGGKAASDFAKALFKNLEFELKEYISYLKSLELEDHIVRQPIMTKAKKDIQELNKTSVDRFMEYLKQFKHVNEIPINEMKVISIKYTSSGDKKVFSDSFYLAYKNFCERFGERGVYSKQNFCKNLAKLNLVAKASRIEGRVYKTYCHNELKTLLSEQSKEEQLKDLHILFDLKPTQTKERVLETIEEDYFNELKTQGIISEPRKNLIERVK